MYLGALSPICSPQPRDARCPRSRRPRSNVRLQDVARRRPVGLAGRDTGPRALVAKTMEVSIAMGVPKNRWFTKENRLKSMMWGYFYVWKPPNRWLWRSGNLLAGNHGFYMVLHAVVGRCSLKLSHGPGFGLYNIRCAHDTWIIPWFIVHRTFPISSRCSVGPSMLGLP